MVRGASSHFSLRTTDFDSYYPLALGVLQNFDLLVGDALRLEDRAFLRAIPRYGGGSGVELEMRRRPKGVDVHVLVVPHEDLPNEPGEFLMRRGAFVGLRGDPASEAMMKDLLPALRRDDMQRKTRDPRFTRTPTNIPEWIFFNLTGGSVTWFLATVLATTGAAYLLFWAPDGPYRTNNLLIAGLLMIIAPWFGGIFSRSAARGFVAGFVTVALPSAVYVVAAMGWGLSGMNRAPGIAAIDVFLPVFQGGAALLVPVILGFLSGIPAAIAGVIGGRLFPIRMKRARSTEPI